MRRAAFLTHRVGVIVCLVFGSAAKVSAYDNCWTGPTSGPWEQQASWSLGILPDEGQSIWITNAGWKAVGIGLATRQNYPGSLLVSNLVVSAPSDSMNELLLNYFSTNVPLHIASGLQVGPNGQLVCLYSGLVVDGAGGGTFDIIDGQVSQEGGVLRVAPATLVTGSTWTMSGADVVLEEVSVGTPEPATVSQTGGSVTCSDLSLNGPATAPPSGGANYNLTNGIFQADTVTVGSGSSECLFNQSGGTVQAASLTLGSYGQGAYNLFAGQCCISTQWVGINSGVGVFTQTGGTNQAGRLVVSSSTTPYYLQGNGLYVLNGGLLQSDTTVVGNGQTTGRFYQNGGRHEVSGLLDVTGASSLSSPYGYYPCSYMLSNGVLQAQTLNLGFAGSLSQSNGVVAVTDSVSLQGYPYPQTTPISWLALQHGEFNCRTLDSRDADILLNGGTLWVTNLLSLNGRSAQIPNDAPAGFAHLKVGEGTLAAGGFEIMAWLELASSARSGRIQSSGVFGFGGYLTAGNANEQFGPMLLKTNSGPYDPPATPTLNLSNGAVRLSFADSSSQTWPESLLLRITNWDGSISGGGADQIRFGTSPSGLSATQLHQIRFLNPAGFPPGVYVARILANGEVVPTLPPMLGATWHEAKLVLSWDGVCHLQTSTNVEGPYMDLHQVSSPFTGEVTHLDRQFFRLRW